MTQIQRCGCDWATLHGLVHPIRRIIHNHHVKFNAINHYVWWNVVIQSRRATCLSVRLLVRQGLALDMIQALDRLKTSGHYMYRQV